MKGKNIIIGITGSIAAHKSCEIIRSLVKKGANIIPVMTKNACNFITPLSVSVLSKNKAYVDMFGTISDWEVEHISISRKADLMIIAPASANIIAKLACGLADDALSTLVLAVKCPVVVCPAMNSAMYANRIVQKNIAALKESGMIFIGPENGELACGTEGKGRMSEPDKIVSEIDKMLSLK
ncbi:MAG: Coenzyme A biosynthesis bifunctional protein CoaBC [Elusimicrobia bacterium ADurb.Bin231]|nr:MAG: Coenzyme A biosynthesis bifunctional protein CoaBC [Elusimicrobia bacterium ADurb.Bin231]